MLLLPAGIGYIGGEFHTQLVRTAPVGEDGAPHLRVPGNLLGWTMQLELRELRERGSLHALRLTAVRQIGVPDAGQIFGAECFNTIRPIRAAARSVVPERTLQSLRVQRGVQLCHRERVAGVVRVGDIHPAPAELGVHSPALQQFPILNKIRCTLRRDPAQLPQIRLIRTDAARLDLLLDLRRLLRMDLGILHALLDLLQSPLLIHGAHTVRPIAFRLRTGALGETFPRHDVGAVDDHVDRVPVGMVLLTVLLVQGEHDLLVRVIPAGVFLGEPHAVLGLEPAAVYIALIGKERQHLMIEDRVLRLDDLAGLLVPTLPRGLVVTVPVAGTRHEGRPLFQIMASGHVLLVTEKNFFIIVDVVA